MIIKQIISGGFVTTEENITSREALSVKTTGGVHVDCWGDNPSEVNILVDIHNFITPEGTPSDHPAVVGIGDSYEPPDGSVGAVLLLINAVDLKVDCPPVPPLSPGSPFVLTIDHAVGIPSFIVRIAIHIVLTSEKSVQFSGLSVGFPGTSTEEYFNVIGSISDICWIVPVM